MRKESKDSEKEIDFGERKISKMNFSHIVTIPKRFIQSTRYEKITTVRLIMADNCLKLVPVRAKNGDEEIDL
ncbi:MAG: hypothetical protein RI100_00545 [Nitrosarchaeum sp.]|jgi:hypothetical protein|uniref:hypothetical protein n=1 Tax=Nitrosarchaeum sp. TaxID=2026886 RepID=UPI002DE26A43|nr:hypothetical protein [Nitrosarchaeum sp.]